VQTSVRRGVGKKVETLKRETVSDRGSVSAISAFSSSGQLLFNVHDGSKRFNSADIIKFLEDILKHHARRHLVVVMDQAKCHTAKKVKQFIDSQKRLNVFYQYSLLS
jgi:DDE superfamily endonuclease